MAVISLHLLIILKFHFATKFYFNSGSCLTLVNSRKCCLMSNRMICFRIKEVGNVCRSNNVRILPSGTIVRESGRSHFFNKAQIIPMDEPAEGGRNDLEEGRSPSSHDWSSLFPRFKECAHFHYEHVNIPGIQLSMVGEKFEVDNYSSSQTQWWLYVLVSSEVRGWTIKRTLTSLLKTDKLLHQCIFNRSASQLPELQDTIATDLGLEKCFKVVANYIESLSTLLQRNIDLVSCGPILAWLEVDNRGNHVSIMEMDSSVNIPAIGAAQVIKPYVAQSSDELTFEVGDIISIIEKPPPHETTWWYGKKDFKVGYFPSECVELITASSKSQTPEKSQQQLIKPVLRKREKFVTFLLSFFSSRPNKTSLKRAGIVKERVFGCDLGEHLSNHDDDVPVILTSCIKFIEEKCITDGVYRLSGAVTSVQKLRCEFDADKVPDLNSPDIVQDLHCVPSLIKMYFRELPNPLLTHQLYDRFLEVQEQKDGTSKLRSFACLMNLLPPPHYRTAKMLFLHLNLMASKHLETSMSSRNLAIIWAPNILQPRQEDQALNLLKKTNMQAAIVDNIISNAEIIFKDLEIKQDSKSGRPLSYVNAPAKLISLDEAQRIFGGRNKDLPSPLEKVAGREGRPLQIHSIINVPKGFVGRKKTTPLKAKWFTSHQDLPSLAKPVEMTDFKRIGSSKRGGDAYQSGSVKINLQPRTPFSDSSPVRTRISLGDVVDSPDDFGACNPLCNSDPNILESADILGEEFASTDAQNDPEMTRDIATPVVKLLPSPKLDFKLAKENLTKTNPAENVVSKVSSEKKMNPESKNENQTKVAAKREPGTMLKKMEKFLQGEVIEEENDTPQKGGPSDTVDQKSASVEFSTRQEKIKEDSSAIMNELKKWKEMKESNNSVPQNLITNTNTRNCRKNLTASFSLNLPEKADKSRRPFVGGRQETIVFVGDSGKHSTEGMKVEPPKKHVDEFQMSSDSKSFQPSMQSTNQNNSSIDFNPPPDCCGSSYVERILPRRNAAGRNFIRRSLCQSSAFTEQKCDYRGASLVTRNPCNTGRLPEDPPSVNLSLSCGDLFVTNPPSYGAFLSPSSFPKSNSNENIFSRGSRLYKRHQVCRSATDHRPLSLRPTDQNFRKVPTDTNTKDLQRPSMKVHYSYPPENMPRNLQPAQEKFVTVINLDSPEQRPNLQTPGSTVIIL